MKYTITCFLTLISFIAWSQQDTGTHLNPVMHASYQRYSTTATVAVGLIDNYRQNYSLPSGFQKSNTSGFAPFSAKLEYGFYKHISAAVMVGYDAFIYNFKQDYIGNNGPFTRYETSTARIWSGGLAAFYHFNNYVHIRQLDPFIGAGLYLNNIRYSAFPQGDSTLTKYDHTVTPYLKAGFRYYISDKFSVSGDVGYDK